MNVGTIEWSCHVCGARRPDAEIGVVTRTRPLIPGVPMQESLRYCRVTDSCAETARDWAIYRHPESYSDGLPPKMLDQWPP